MPLKKNGSIFVAGLIRAYARWEGRRKGSRRRWLVDILPHPGAEHIDTGIVGDSLESETLANARAIEILRGTLQHALDMLPAPNGEQYTPPISLRGWDGVWHRTECDVWSYAGGCDCDNAPAQTPDSAAEEPDDADQ